MLSRPHRLTRAAEYRAVVRGASRCAGAHTITYRLRRDDAGPVRFGFIVSKKVGTAVVRNTVRRRLKAIGSQLREVPPADVVIRALPSAAAAPFSELRADVQRCLARATA